MNCQCCRMQLIQYHPLTYAPKMNPVILQITSNSVHQNYLVIFCLEHQTYIGNIKFWNSKNSLDFKTRLFITPSGQKSKEQEPNLLCSREFCGCKKTKPQLTPGIVRHHHHRKGDLARFSNFMIPQKTRGHCTTSTSHSG